MSVKIIHLIDHDEMVRRWRAGEHIEALAKCQKVSYAVMQRVIAAKVPKEERLSVRASRVLAARYSR